MIPIVLGFVAVCALGVVALGTNTRVAVWLLAMFVAIGITTSLVVNERDLLGDIALGAIIGLPVLLALLGVRQRRNARQERKTE